MMVMETAFKTTSYYRAVAIDFDGTLAEGRVAADALAAVREARDRGIQVILATGRIVSELRTVFPDVEDHFDAIVAENGAVLVTRSGIQDLVTPVDRSVSIALQARGAAHRNGRVLIAAAAADEPIATDVIRELGLDCRLLRNRSELMLLPAGVTKGSGLLEALAGLGLSAHNTIGVGDAENDHSLVGVEPARRFYFRTVPDTPTGAVAANLAELQAELARCERGVLRHHCPDHDFSHWIAEILHDQPLAASIAAAEAELQPDSPAEVAEHVRTAFITVFTARQHS